MDGGPEENAPQASKAPKTFIKHETHWAADGSLLLQIGDTRFKVLKSRLVSESTWFAALIEQRSGIVPAEPFPDQDEIDRVLATVEEVDGLDLFYLDVDNYPNHLESFSLLLTSMSNAIDYIYSPPKLADTVLLLEAADFYRAQRYVDFCITYIVGLLPDRMPGGDPANRALLVKGVKLARRYPGLSLILRPAFYDLARLWPADDDDDDDDGQYDDLSVADDDDATVNGDAKRASALEKLESSDLVLLLDIQKRLVFAWNDIVDIMEYKCESALCHKHHVGRIHHIRRAMAFDPIRGIHMILASPPVFAKGHYCAESTPKIREMLRKERNRIWKDIHLWYVP
ncbi:hypothetical protein HYPSUDRAFT_203100 [Hypholoma sublateritium FD-334 SS-4]|uniref:BTB domain-containing protein n=1 Tax=Hypholoma sublateritium (strain FD-334 SS-4) TaxID=945553 RepID=A0A0D2L3I5_HYPSF|nr:hypothetical protein HYPSUDRAFT_203100 [Hypholoma sublateritium FD-334 SS-4]